MPYYRKRKAPILKEKEEINKDLQSPTSSLKTNGRPGRPKGSKNGNGKRPKDPYQLMTPNKACALLAAHEAEIKAVRKEFQVLEDEKLAEKIAEAKANGINISKRTLRKSRAGAPTKYKGKDTCKQIIRYMAVGMGLMEASCEIGVMYETVRVWQTKHPEFAVAVKIGKKLCEKWWLDMGRGKVAESASGFNATLWMMNMTNRFNWVRKDERTETVKGSKTVTHKHKHVVEEIAKRSSEHTAEVVRILVESGVLSAEAQRPADTSLH